MEEPTTPQIQSSVRWFITAFGGAIAGFVTGKGWATTDQVMAFLNSPFLASVAVTLVPLVWGWIAHTKKAMVTSTNALPEVAGVITKSTPEGIHLAQAIPETAVTPAGTSTAQVIAEKGTIA